MPQILLSRAELESLLGTEYHGVLCSDDFSVYNGYPATAQQKCLAHMRRHFLRLIKCPGKDNAAIGEVFVNLIDDVFDNYRSFQASHDLVAYADWAIGFKSKQRKSHQEVDAKSWCDSFKLVI